jgi:uncharacterized repeat protein (TIGR01451 family)
MYLRHYLFLFPLSILLCSGGLLAQSTIIVTDDDLLAGTYNWTSDNEYVLDGTVVLESGGELTIDPGTVIRGRRAINISTGDRGSVLVIARGARIIAAGRADAPIIFTAEEDDLTTAEDNLNNNFGTWGGLAILGNAPVSTLDGTAQMTGFFNGGDRFTYGGGDEADDSGILHYVSIRYGGSDIGDGNSASNLYLAGVGSSTTIDHVEAYGSGHTGFSLFGGTVNAYHLIAGYCRYDAFRMEHGYRGAGQFWLGLSSRGRLLEIGSSRFEDVPVTRPDLANLTLVAGTPQSNIFNSSISFQSNTGGYLENNLFVYAPYDTFDHKIAFEVIDDLISHEDTEDTYDRWLAGDLTLVNNHVSIETGGPLGWAGLLFLEIHSLGTTEVSEQEAIRNYAAENNVLDTQVVIRSSSHDDFDPLPPIGSPVLTAGIPSNRPGLTPVPYQGAFGTENWMKWSYLGGNVLYGQLITGSVFQADEGCEADPAAPAAGIIVVLTTNGNTCFATTDADGNYSAFVPQGTTTVSAVSPYWIWETCLPEVSVTLAAGESASANFTLRPSEECAAPIIDIGAPFLRRGFLSTYYLTYANSGSATAENTEVLVVLDSFLTYQSSSIPLAAQLGDTLIFEVDEMPALSNPETFSLTVEVSLEAELGREHCTTATINSGNTCGYTGGAELRVSGGCVGDSIRFEVLNIGDAGPLAPVPYVVIEDEVMLINSTFLPAPGVAEKFTFAAEGQTFNFSTLARPDAFRPGRAAATASCAENPEIPFSSFATLGPIPNSAVDCQPNIGAYDPNDKAATPTGVTRDNIVPKEVVLDYRIRFQNTGTDTAFTVVVVDDLPAELDPATFVMGTSSHPCTWKLEGESALTVTFNNIMLPDSNVNQPASNGFFHFSIAARAGLDWGTEIRNKADIYFDFNQSIVTNETYHLIDRLRRFPVAVEEVRKHQLPLLLYPQPANGEVFVEFKNGAFLSGSWTIFSIDGRQVAGGVASGIRQCIPLTSMTPGVHLFVLRGNDGQLLAQQRFLVR